MEKRITRWLEQGLITKEIALNLLKDVKEEKDVKPVEPVKLTPKEELKQQLLKALGTALQ